MRHLITASHGPLATAILESAAFIGGNALIAPVDTIIVEREDSGDDIHAKIKKIFSKYQMNDEIIVMTDVFGGNVTNILTEYSGNKKLHLITGMNLPMVLEALLADPDISAEELSVRLKAAAKDGVRYVNDFLDQEGEEI